MYIMYEFSRIFYKSNLTSKVQGYAFKLQAFILS